MLLAARYELLETIGEGGVATVWRALDTLEGRTCAVKVVRVDQGHHAVLAQRLVQEAELLMRVAHPNVVQVFGAGDSERGPWLAMEFVEGGTVAEQIERDGPMSPRRALQVALQVARGLEVVHQQGIVHRDVKPDNLLLTSDGTCKLADFGIARVAEQTRHTASGFAMGSLPYMAPEQRVDAHGVDARADLYAVGATLYFLMSGATPVDLFLAAPSSPRFEGLPEGIVELVRRTTHADPAARFATASQLADALTAALRQASDVALQAPVEPVYAGSTDAGRVQTAVVAETSGDVLAIEAHMRREWRDEESVARRRSSRWIAPVSLAIVVTLLGVVAAVAGRISLDDWIARERARQVALTTPVMGVWRGTVDTVEAEVELSGTPSLLYGTFTWKGPAPRVDRIRGVMEQGLLVLEVVGPEHARYQALLENRGRLDGDYISVTNRVPFHLVQVESRPR